MPIARGGGALEWPIADKVLIGELRKDRKARFDNGRSKDIEA